MDKRSLGHLTFNTNHLRGVSPRSEVSDDTIMVLQPLLQHERSNPIPSITPWHVGCLLPEDGGMAFFQIADGPGMSTPPAIMGVTCWRQDAQADAWDLATSAYGGLRKHLPSGINAPPRTSPPPRLPWLVVWLTPFAVGLDLETMGMFGDLERCIAWSLIESDSSAPVE